MAIFSNYPFTPVSKLDLWESLSLKVRQSKNINHLVINGKEYGFHSLKAAAGTELMVTLKDQGKVNQLLEL